MKNKTKEVGNLNQIIKQSSDSGFGSDTKINNDSNSVGIGNDKNILKSMSNIITGMSEFYSLYNSMQMQISSEKNLREEIEEEIKDISNSHRRIDEIYRQIQTNYEERLDSLFTILPQLQKSDEKNKQRMFILEKEKEKEGFFRKNLKNNVFNSQKANVIEPQCVNRNSCRVCLEDPSCIWCKSSNKCMLGDSSGSIDGSCNGNDLFFYSSCPLTESKCGFKKTCTDCIQNKLCGWCEVNSICIEGTISKPIGLLCPDKNYFHLNKQGRCSSHSQQNYSFK